MVGPPEFETSPLQHRKADYLSKLPEVDRQNIERLTELFIQVMTEKGRVGLLLAVGGTLTKPLPRKDIDLAIAFKQEPADPNIKDYPDILSFSTAEYRVFRDIINTMLKLDPSYQITKTIEPFMDHEFQNPNILAHDGDVVVVNQFKEGAPLEFSREYTFDRTETMAELITKRDRPFVVLAYVSPGISSEFQQLSLRQKEEFIRKKLAAYQGDISERGWRELTVTLLHPEVLTEGDTLQPRLPIQHARLTGITPDVTAGKRNKVKFITVDLSGTTPINNLSYAQFGLGAVEVGTQGQIYIDCSRLESSKGTGQGIFPQNTFVERPTK